MCAPPRTTITNPSHPTLTPPSKPRELLGDVYWQLDSGGVSLSREYKSILQHKSTFMSTTIEIAIIMILARWEWCSYWNEATFSPTDLSLSKQNSPSKDENIPVGGIAVAITTLNKNYIYTKYCKSIYYGHGIARDSCQSRDEDPDELTYR